MSDQSTPGSETFVYVIPCKNGCWRTIRMTKARFDYWQLRYRRWFATTGHKLARSPEMWI